MRLNKFLAHADVGTRRKCATLIKSGKVLVNDVVELNPAYVLEASDIVSYQSTILKHRIELAYLLLNKPKNTLTSTIDEKGRPTVIELIKEKHIQIVPVDRLDYGTTGLLILTNDDELIQKLNLPSLEIKKVYSVTLNREITVDQLNQIRDGLMLSDGKAVINSVDYADGEPKSRVGVTLHLDRHQMIKRIFEQLGFEVIKLDRIYYAGLTKKDLPRGRYRKLTEMELTRLRHFNKL